MLLVGAMWALLGEQGLTDEKLAAKLVELDEAVGTADGRRTRLPSTCRGCGSKVAVGLDAFQFCGAALLEAESPGPFSTL